MWFGGAGRSTKSRIRRRVTPGASGACEVVEAVVVAFERRGITTIIDPASDNVLDAVLSDTEPELLATWGRHRGAVLELADAVVTLGAGPIPTERASTDALTALRAGREVMEEVEARRSLPFLVVAIATPRLAAELGHRQADVASNRWTPYAANSGLFARHETRQQAMASR